MKTDEEEFMKFTEKLMNPKTAPKGYKPWFIRCKKKGKDPDTKISWKAEKSRLTPAEAKRRLRNNWGNVGIAGRRNDRLLLLDVDDPEIESELKPTLKIRSRSRVGTHAIYWADPEDEKLPANIPTEEGELRTDDQYVVAPGSFVPCKETELREKRAAGEITREQKQQVMQDSQRGYYTLDNDREINTLSFEELPKVFQEEYRKRKEREKKAHEEKEDFNPDEVASKGNRSALFDLSISDLTARGFDGRDPHPLHASDTGANWSISEGVGHCWRHEVSLNALQFLCVECGYLSCHEAGTPHNGAGSAVIGNNEAIWKAWLHAKKEGYIPEDDKIPAKAMKYLARKHDVYEPKEDELLPKPQFNEVVRIVEEKY